MKMMTTSGTIHPRKDSVGLSIKSKSQPECFFTIKYCTTIAFTMWYDCLALHPELKAIRDEARGFEAIQRRRLDGVPSTWVMSS